MSDVAGATREACGRWAGIAAVLLAAVFVAGLSGGDGLIAKALAGRHAEGPFLSTLVSSADLVSGKKISNFLLGPLLALLGVVLRFAFGKRHAGQVALIVGLSQLACVVAADFAKPLFGRLRPFQALAEGPWHDSWFMGAQFGSFPSGHAAFYGSLFLPFALLRPRWSPFFLLLPVSIGTERVLSTDHYLSDVAGGLLLALGTAILAAKWIGREALPAR